MRRKETTHRKADKAGGAPSNPNQHVPYANGTVPISHCQLTRRRTDCQAGHRPALTHRQALRGVEVTKHNRLLYRPNLNALQGPRDQELAIARVAYVTSRRDDTPCIRQLVPKIRLDHPFCLVEFTVACPSCRVSIVDVASLLSLGRQVLQLNDLSTARWPA